MTSFYQPRDTRLWGTGMNFGFNLEVSNSLKLGYRVEVLNWKVGEAVGGAWTQASGIGISHGLAAYYTTYRSDPVGVELGLWTGMLRAATVVALPVTAHFVEPLARVVYSPTRNKEAQIRLGLGYRFVRGFNPIPSVNGPLRNLDGLDINIGIGMFF